MCMQATSTDHSKKLPRCGIAQQAYVIQVPCGLSQAIREGIKVLAVDQYDLLEMIPRA